MTATIAPNKVPETGNVFIRVAQSAARYAIYEVSLVERTFDSSLKHMTPEDKLVVKRADDDSIITCVRHDKIPQLVVEGTNHRVSFLEIDEESTEMKKISDQIAEQDRLAKEAEEKRKELQRKASAASRQRHPNSTAGLPKLEKLQIMAQRTYKRAAVMAEDLEKARQRSNELINSLKECGYETTIVDGELKFSKIQKDQTEIPNIHTV